MRVQASHIPFYNLSSRPYLLFFDITKCVSYATILGGCPTPQICAEQCPTQYFSYLELQYVSGAAFRTLIDSSLVCDETVDKSQLVDITTVKNMVQVGRCAAYTVNSASVMGRCLPEILLETGGGIASSALQTQSNGSLNALKTLYGDAGIDNKASDFIPSDASINSTGQ